MHARIAALDVLLARGEAVQIVNVGGVAIRNRWLCKGCGHKHTRNGKPSDYVSPYPCVRCGKGEFEIVEPLIRLAPATRVWTWSGPFPPDRRLSDCGLSTRSANSLMRTAIEGGTHRWNDYSTRGIATVADLLAFRLLHAGAYQSVMLRIPNFGRLCLAETLSLLAAIDAASMGAA